ncbi:putative metal-binding protein [Nocardioides sp. MH1]|uniref:putative metal-binding protein n=1 Tax=Nocardioides sp. MH1 TaxID=3242490 RepID=UPI003521C44A
MTAAGDGRARGPLLVPPEVTRAKFDQQITQWHEHAETYAQRGWQLLSVDDLSVDVGMVRHIQMGGRALPVITVCVRIDYWNFDLWPPSVTFIDPISRQPSPPLVRAVSFDHTSTEPRDALIDAHPDTMQPFLCLPGIREYHNHPQHTGDDWLLHRHRHEGDLATVCERLWLRMARNVVGSAFAAEVRQVSSGDVVSMPFQFQVQLLQDDPDAIERNFRQQKSHQEAFDRLVAEQAAGHGADSTGTGGTADQVPPAETDPAPSRRERYESAPDVGVFPTSQDSALQPSAPAQDAAEPAGQR